MDKKQMRQQNIINFIQSNNKVSNSEILDFLGDVIERTTLQRDLNFLIKQSLIAKSGSGRGTVYFVSEINKIFLPVNVKEYFDIPYLQREIKGSFNFEIFDILSHSIFTMDEKEKLEKLQEKFVRNFSKYDSQTIINKEFERIMIEFSWKSSVIEGNTYSLLGTEALIKNNVIGEGKTKEETQMILNHKDAFNKAIQNKDRFRKLNYSGIEYIHSVLIKKLGISRNIRNEGVGVTGTKYTPLDNGHQINEAVQKMVNLINNKEFFLRKLF
ncbi:MAG: cell filamentation protein Fic [Candidatus Komeilibacteria bacterium CG_4_9_14_0_8_um_filter_36_9]|uniref:Cell filamentation protein Fic n=2 Tax=Candidatus Komeiliibacteriota TaxID=1817908 RepID=A0A2M8DRL9_9BACT|nr:MAG: cell filamentation protein Fic [Candidatus Komeilibacteria bacterium CG_4_10_14_0_8_um_filter_37_78]PJC02029.1 MAG: cell filamentation protein Fic [Candidatus Komeilibacteria bacterium CG_4_9_14_0_8_um_filter_36_9]